MEVMCKTNLDIDPRESFPTDLDALPLPGHRIVSNKIWSNGFQLELEVVAVKWSPRTESPFFGEKATRWIPEIEMNLPPYIKSITDFTEIYKKRF